MKKLPIHKISFTQMLGKCSEGMNQINVRNNFNSLFPLFLEKEQQYEELSSVGSLFMYPKTDPLEDTTTVIGNLTKTKLVNLYENNLTNSKKPARIYYDDLLVASGEKCPFCGDIGHTKNLDHFLPKAHFPEFSVMPLNLVPSCRDCNMGEKGASYATTENNQAIHPFSDKNLFFQVQWVFADYIDEDDGVINYYVSCPDDWRQEDKDRAFNHFHNLNLASRYRLEAGKHLSEVIDQKNAFKNWLIQYVPSASFEMIKSGFIESNLQPLINSNQIHNHWKKVMYRCLANSDDFFQD